MWPLDGFGHFVYAFLVSCWYIPLSDVAMHKGRQHLLNLEHLIVLLENPNSHSAYSRKHILTLSLVIYFLTFSPWIWPFDLIDYSGFEVNSVAFGQFWNILLILFWCHGQYRSVSQVVMHEVDNTNSIWSTWLCYQWSQFLTVAYSSKYVLILSLIIIIVLFSLWMCLFNSTVSSVVEVDSVAFSQP